jgi:hypothetical protein
MANCYYNNQKITFMLQIKAEIRLTITSSNTSLGKVGDLI